EGAHLPQPLAGVLVLLREAAREVERLGEAIRAEERIGELILIAARAHPFDVAIHLVERRRRELVTLAVVLFARGRPVALLEDAPSARGASQLERLAEEVRRLVLLRRRRAPRELRFVAVHLDV